MAKGMTVPVRTNHRGGAATREGSSYTRQAILIGLTPNLSSNPFQAGDGVEVGISERVVFGNNTPATQSLARKQITNFFIRARAAEIAKLAPGRDGVRFVTEESGELTARVRYVELEADRESELSTNLKDGLRTGAQANLGT
jgi:hypothetical protein